MSPCPVSIPLFLPFYSALSATLLPLGIRAGAFVSQVVHPRSAGLQGHFVHFTGTANTLERWPFTVVKYSAGPTLKAVNSGTI